MTRADDFVLSLSSSDLQTALRTGPVLVTGGGGFIGRHLLQRLLDAGCEVHACHRRDTPPAGFEGVEWRRVDLADADATARWVAEVSPSRVLHLASRVAGARDLELVLPTFRDNLASTLHLLDAFARLESDDASPASGARRFVQVGSLEEPDSGAAPVPSSPYAAAKAAASAYLRMFHQLYATPVVLARLFMVYGPGPQDERKLVPYVARALLAGGTPRLSSGTRPVDWIYVDDVVEGLLRAAVAPGLDGSRVDLGTGRLDTVREVVEGLYRRLAPQQTPEFGGLDDRANEQVRSADVDDTARRLGWRPEVSLREGLDRTAAWFRDANRDSDYGAAAEPPA